MKKIETLICMDHKEARINIMAQIKFRFVYDENGKKVGVILEAKDFEAMVDKLEDYQDYEFVRQRSHKKEKLYTFEEVKRETLARMKK